MPRADADAAFLPEYVREPDVSPELDRELRELISGAFKQPHNAFFQIRRYAQEMPRHRYLFRSRAGRLVAHLAVHDKRLGVADTSVAIGGIAEVCVHEAARGRGLVRQLLTRAHDELRERAVEFAFLFGDPKIYGSSGYHAVAAPIRSHDPVTGRSVVAPNPLALVKPLGARAWPEGPIDLRGPLF
jgi:predicted N-acetyltransferase YhbS